MAATPPPKTSMPPRKPKTRGTQQQHTQKRTYNLRDKPDLPTDTSPLSPMNSSLLMDYSPIKNSSSIPTLLIQPNTVTNTVNTTPSSEHSTITIFKQHPLVNLLQLKQYPLAH